MADPAPNPAFTAGADNDGGGQPNRRTTAGTPRWVKVFGIIALVLVLIFAILLLTGGGGGHGPSRHTLPFSVTEHDVRQA